MKRKKKEVIEVFLRGPMFEFALITNDRNDGYLSILCIAYTQSYNFLILKNNNNIKKAYNYGKCIAVNFYQ